MIKRCTRCKLEVDKCKCTNEWADWDWTDEPDHKNLPNLEEPKVAKRFNSNKVEIHDIPLFGMTEVAKVGAYGSGKYDVFNWKEDAPVTQYLNCIFRHFLRYMYGETNDPESKCHHIAHVAWNALSLLEKMLVGRQVDDRHKYPQSFDMNSAFTLNAEQLAAIKREKDKKENEK